MFGHKDKRKYNKLAAVAAVLSVIAVLLSIATLRRSMDFQANVLKVGSHDTVADDVAP